VRQRYLLHRCAQPRSLNFLKPPTHNSFPDGSARLYSAVPERRLAPVRSQNFTFSLAAKSADHPCNAAAFVKPGPHTGAHPSVRLCVGLIN
jgi:hypothetical protein